MADSFQRASETGCKGSSPKLPAERRERKRDGDCEGSEARLAQLVEIIERETIPRLMQNHREPIDVPSGDGSTVSPDEIRRMAKLVLSEDAEAARVYARQLLLEGLPLGRLFLELLAPTARYLGRLWDEDLCDFTEVTVGLCRLHQVLRELSPAFRRDADSTEENRRVLLAPLPGEQHTFGILMVAEFFRRAGWEVAGGPSFSHDDIVAAVRSDWFDVVGLSVSSERDLNLLTESIRSIRQGSRNPDITLMVGGRVFVERPDLAALVGADGTAMDGRQAPSKALELPAGSVGRC